MEALPTKPTTPTADKALLPTPKPSSPPPRHKRQKVEHPPVKGTRDRVDPVVMNYDYSLNNSPYSVPQGQHHPGNGSYSGSPVQNNSANSTPAGQYGGGYLPTHHPPYISVPHGYPPYNSFPQPTAVYGGQRSNPPPELRTSSSTAPSPAPIATPVVTVKRKRKSNADAPRKNSGDKDSDPEAGGSGSDMTRTATSQSATSAEMKKRTKTQRACDSCRSRKIRCDVLSDAEPPSCQHCKQYGFECTFFLPITETRFKKKKTEDTNEIVDKEKSIDNLRDTASPHAETKRDPRVFGPTTAVHLLHSQATISSKIYESYDQRYHHTWEVSNTGNGLIQVEEPPTQDQPAPLTKPIDLRLDRDVIERLLNAYFTDVAPIFPVITKEEFLANPLPPPILLYSMCLIAAGRREVPQSVFDSIRYAVNGLIKAEDVLSTASIVNVQSLLILCMMGDSHSQFVPNALSGLWIRLGTAIRMAQDLGLHRAESVKQNIELRRRLWGACVISDRWTALTYGHPYMIDVHDCDTRLPSSGDPNDLYMDESVRLSVLLGRVLKTIYSPSGLTFSTDTILHSLLKDLDAWKENLPESLQFKGVSSSRNAGLLHLLYSCVCMIFWRVFMRISYSCPDHLKFNLAVEQWSGLVQLTADSIDWLDAHESIYDVWLIVAYATTSLALVQYHTWVRRKDPDAVAKLRKLRDTVRRWEAAISPDHMSARRKTAEIIALLYEATQGPQLPPDTPPALNPTVGIVGKQPPPVNGLHYRKDLTRAGSGVFIAKGITKDNYKDIPPGIILSESDVVEHHNDENEDGLNRPAAQSSSSSNFVTITPLGGEKASNSFPNVNPAMNDALLSSPGNVQVMNVLDVPQSSATLEQFALTDSGFLEGIPGGMFDWGQWDTFFSRFNASIAEGTGHMTAQ